ncbi:baculoviral IAP repeat-containing protein 7-like [Branchiostoma floridae x Branchiostoma japonicum]
MVLARSSDGADGRQITPNQPNQRQSNPGESNGKASLNGSPIGQPANMDIHDRYSLITKHRNGREDDKFVKNPEGSPVRGTGAGPHMAHGNGVDAGQMAYRLAPKFDNALSEVPKHSNSSKGNYETDAVDGGRTYNRSDHPSRRTETTRVAASSNYYQTRNLNTERDRLSTYFDWPQGVPVTPEELARQGFFYLGHEDRVECAFCGGVLHQWEAGDDPFIEHRRHYPHCPFANGEATANVPLGATSPPTGSPATAHAVVSSPSYQPPSSSTPALVTSGQVEPQRTGSRNTSVFALPVGTEWPKQPDFADEQSRLSTFHNWPRYSPMSPLRLVRAGFLYTYVADHVRCYWCDGGLKDWQQDDDPWEEHARWYGSECGYVIMNKGMDYIREVRTRRPPVVQQPQFRWGVEAGVVQSVLDMGFDENRVQAVIQNYWQRYNRPFTTATELLNALLPQEEVPFYPPNEEEEPPFTFQNAPVFSSPAPAPRPVDEQPLDPETMERELRRLREERQCKVCLSADACMVFIPCGHLCCCEHCANMLRMRGRRCPLCRALFQRVQRAFLA